ncbi:hypothetical protein GN277_02680 [Lachnospiraceae bacterium WCA-9-b2]|uniref:Uncharacterized protein n=1 Tax=Sporofaciens musculi TaxID=2681861 RepID=A0A7X3SHG9_9FIRM|nr:hypothetical protein [Sporofaciens musculi]MXP74365.1 hypothetical protein [Sporofaciens musculi]
MGGFDIVKAAVWQLSFFDEAVAYCVNIIAVVYVSQIVYFFDGFSACF